MAKSGTSLERSLLFHWWIRGQKKKRRKKLNMHRWIFHDKIHLILQHKSKLFSVKMWDMLMVCLWEIFLGIPATYQWEKKCPDTSCQGCFLRQHKGGKTSIKNTPKCIKCKIKKSINLLFLSFNAWNRSWTGWRTD